METKPRWLKHEILNSDIDDLIATGETRITLSPVHVDGLRNLVRRASELKLTELSLGFSHLGSVDISVLEAFPNLEKLNLPDHDKGRLDFTKFKNLRSLGFKYRPPLISAFDHSGLERLNVTSYPFEDLMPISHMKNLWGLMIYGGKLKSTRGIDQLPSITRAELTMLRHLEDLEGVDKLPIGYRMTPTDKWYPDWYKVWIVGCGKITKDTPGVEFTEKGLM